MRKNSKSSKIKRSAVVGAVTLLMAASGLTGYKLVEIGKSKLDDCNCQCGNLEVVERVVDGDTLLMKDGERVRVIGVDAPDRGECYFEETFEVVKKLVEGKKVRLEKDVSGMDQFGRLLRYVMIPSGDDKKDDLNLSNYLVRNGWAEAVTSAPDLRYRQMMIGIQQEAVRGNLGIWKECDYKTETSDQWQANVEPTSEDCIIKGNISQHDAGMVYMIPGCDNYLTTKIDPKRGERYFCSEKEAEEAGFRKATNCP